MELFTYMWVIFRVNVGKYAIHGAYGITWWLIPLSIGFVHFDH